MPMKIYHFTPSLFITGAHCPHSAPTLQSLNVMLCHQVDPPNVPCRLARRRQDNHILLLATAQRAEHGATAHQYRITDRITGRAALASGAIGNATLAGVTPSDEPHRRDRGVHDRGCWHGGPPLKCHSLPTLKRIAADSGQLRPEAFRFRCAHGSDLRPPPVYASSVSVVLADAGPRSAVGHRWPWHPSPGPSPRRSCGPRAETASWHGPWPR